MVKGKRNKISAANISRTVPHSYPITTVGQVVQSETEEAKDASDTFSGYIFMCNTMTKPECFRYRVFGLPAGKREIVEKIKTGMKLFLYDFDSKLLYGVYEASCNGQLNLEPYAFEGKYPAQVKFSIHRECLPLPERVLKRVIEDNYIGFKFNQELSGFHVRNLMSSFRPLNVEMPIPPIALEYQVRLPPTDNSYDVGIQPNASMAINRYHSLATNSYQDLSGRHGIMLNHVPRTMGHLNLPRPPDNPYYEENTSSSYLPESVPQQLLRESLRVNDRAQNMRRETHYAALSYYQEPYHPEPIGEVATGIGLYQANQESYLPEPIGEVATGIGLYQTNYSEESQPIASSHYGIPNYVPASQPTESSHYGIPNHLSVSQPTEPSHYGIPNYLQVTQPTEPTHYGIPGHTQASSYHFHYEP